MLGVKSYDPSVNNRLVVVDSWYGQDNLLFSRASLQTCVSIGGHRVIGLGVIKHLRIYK